jgi:sugar fermentation stimulation protein A
MKFDRPLMRATLIRRYKRFLADVTLQDGREVTAHVANPGSMMGMADAGMTVWVEPNDDPKRKLNYSWKIAQVGGALIGVDTGAANKVVKEVLQSGALDFGYTDFKPEVKYGEGSRVDFLLTDADKPDLYLEVKSVTLLRDVGLAEFPDSKTARGAKHMNELAQMVAEGKAATLLFLVMRDDAERVDVARDIDLNYGTAFDAARAAGVDVLCYDCDIGVEGIMLGKQLPLANPLNSVLSSA